MANIWNQPRCLTIDDWIKKMWHIYSQQDITQPKKKKNEITDICNKMDTTGDLYAKWNKPGLKRQIIHFLLFVVVNMSEYKNCVDIMSVGVYLQILIH